MRRKHSWPEDLHAFIESRVGAPFAWGMNDCCLFSADAIQSMTVVDVAAEFRGKYTDEASAMAIIKTVTGGATVEDAANHAATKYGLQALPSVLFAQRGDLLLYSDPQTGLSLGIVYHNGKDGLFVGAKGLHRLPIKKCAKAWRV